MSRHLQIKYRGKILEIYEKIKIKKGGTNISDFLEHLLSKEINALWPVIKFYKGLHLGISLGHASVVDHQSGPVVLQRYLTP